MSSIAFNNKLNINKSFYGIYFYRINAKDLNYAKNKVSTLKFNDIIRYMPL